jgi:hypothetical protein
VASEIEIETEGTGKPVTRYRFSDLLPIPGRRIRKDLIVVSTKKFLPNNFIRSYAIVRTPEFLQPGKREQN